MRGTAPKTTQTVSEAFPTATAASDAAKSCPFDCIPADSPDAPKNLTLDDVVKANKLRSGKKTPRWLRTSLDARSARNHPDPRKSIKLYHGTSLANARIIWDQGVKLPQDRGVVSPGEFNPEGMWSITRRARLLSYRGMFQVHFT
jgi:hypothetical protein